MHIHLLKSVRLRRDPYGEWYMAAHGGTGFLGPAGCSISVSAKAPSAGCVTVVMLYLLDQISKR